MRLEPRLESIGGPRGVMVSATVFDQVKNRLSITLDCANAAAHPQGMAANVGLRVRGRGGRYDVALTDTQSIGESPPPTEGV